MPILGQKLALAAYLGLLMLAHCFRRAGCSLIERLPFFENKINLEKCLDSLLINKP